MNFVLEDHEENDDEVIREEARRNFLFSPSSSCATSKYKTQEPATNFDKKLELLDLSLGGNNNEYQSNIGNSSSSRSIEKEHMFDKVVTPSDVGKLNRLVIPKQHAEKYFPLDSSSNENGLLLNFEDSNGKSWRFRYSYWNSSQSYVMTKGWSRFVKDKKLDAGDTVSFQRSVGKDSRYYIDWRCRPNVPDPTTLAHIQLQSQFNYPQSVRWRSLYSVPQTSMCMSRNYEPLHRLNYSMYPYSHRHHHHHQQQQQQHQLQHHQAISHGNVGQYYHPRSSPLGSHHRHQIGVVPVQHGRGGQPMVIDSMPVVQGTKKTVAKRLRLFGVNMECPTQDGSSSSFPRATIGPDESLHFSNNSNNNSPQSGMQAEYSKKGKYSSFDLGL